MIVPIYAYGHPVLKQIAAPISPDYPALADILTNMRDTMYKADGIGIAAPQIGLSIRIFVIDTTQIKKDAEKPTVETDMPIKKTFINAEMLEESGKKEPFEEGCLSIPRIRGDVERLNTIRIRYQDEHFQEHTEVFTGINARVIQHEYDHIQGVLFTDHFSAFRRRLIQNKLNAIKSGNIQADYKMKFGPQ